MLFLLIAFGSIRYDMSKAKGKDTITVAAVGTDSKTSGLPLPTKERTELTRTALFKRTRTAAEGGAKIISWNEAAIFIMPEDEKEWINSIKELASELNITLVASYVSPISQSPLRYQKQFPVYRFVRKHYAYIPQASTCTREPSCAGKVAFKSC